MRKLTVGSLFSGIGGFDLGLERSGMHVIWQSEIDPYACAVLKKHWPEVPNYGDVRRMDPGTIPRVDVICGGFPCQPFSSAARGRRNGKADDRYLWPQMCRLVSAIRPAWVIGENVAHFDGMALAEVETDLVRLGYEVAIMEIPACAVGHDHRRERNWILGYTYSDSKSWRPFDAEVAGVSRTDDDSIGVGAEDGISGGVDANRMRVLGNAIVPQIAEIIGRAIIAAEANP